jgi:hypothetical protein
MGQVTHSPLPVALAVAFVSAGPMWEAGLALLIKASPSLLFVTET